MAEVKAQLERGGKNRAVGAHDMNEHSSRSHMIFNVRGKRKRFVFAFMMIGNCFCSGRKESAFTNAVVTSSRPCIVSTSLLQQLKV